MTAIQTLNFFKYVDSLTTAGANPIQKSDTINEIYENIARLTDEELLKFLTELHRHSTDTAEFNFYGAYRIDPALIQTIHYFPHEGSSYRSSFR